MIQQFHLLLCIYPKELEMRTPTNTCYWMFNTVPSGQKMETTQVTLADKWMNKLWYPQTLECYSAIRRMKYGYMVQRG